MISYHGQVTNLNGYSMISYHGHVTYFDAKHLKIPKKLEFFALFGLVFTYLDDLLFQVPEELAGTKGEAQQCVEFVCQVLTRFG